VTLYGLVKWGGVGGISMVPIVLLTMGEGIGIVENITVLIKNRTRSYRESQNFY